MPRIIPSLWFADQALEAAEFYCSVFPRSSIDRVVRYPEGAHQPAGEVLVVDFTLDGCPAMALNAGVDRPFTEAISLMVECPDQAEIDYYWEALGAGGEHGPCGWLKDRYGLSWQIAPVDISALYAGDPAGASRALAAMMTMGKLDIAALKAAAAGETPA